MPSKIKKNANTIKKPTRRRMIAKITSMFKLWKMIEK